MYVSINLINTLSLRKMISAPRKYHFLAVVVRVRLDAENLHSRAWQLIRHTRVPPGTF
jgi:hypothetical protein